MKRSLLILFLWFVETCMTCSCTRHGTPAAVDAAVDAYPDASACSMKCSRECIDPVCFKHCLDLCNAAGDAGVDAP